MFEMAPNYSPEMLSTISKLKGLWCALQEKIYTYVYSEMNYNAVGCEFNVIESTL